MLKTEGLHGRADRFAQQIEVFHSACPVAGHVASLMQNWPPPALSKICVCSGIQFPQVGTRPALSRDSCCYEARVSRELRFERALPPRLPQRLARQNPPTGIGDYPLNNLRCPNPPVSPPIVSRYRSSSYSAKRWLQIQAHSPCCPIEPAFHCS
jgi:hypothetical protein